MRIIYYVVQPQLEEVDEFQETNGWKDVRVYQIVDNELKSMGSIEIPTEENSEEEILEYIMGDIDEDEIIKLVQL
jgi:hypothetical protein